MHDESSPARSEEAPIRRRNGLTDYFERRKAISAAFCAEAAVAEAEFEAATRSANDNDAFDAAHDVLKAKFHAANQTRLNALKALGPPPNMPA